MGQRFLVDEGVLSRQVEYARLHTGDVVLEIGAGTGNLTKYLVKGDWDVVVIERDSSLVKLLRHRFHDAPNLKVIHGDVLRMKFPKFNKVVSNIPYAISASLTFKLLEHNFELAILTYQREFAERLIAKPGTRNYSRISVSTYCKADVKILEYVSRNAFYPAPQVSSAVVKITPKTKPLAVEEDVFQNLLRGLFSHRRKTLPNATFHSYSFLTGCNPPKDLKRANIRRFIPEHLWDKKVYELTPEEFTEISKALAPLRGRKYNKPTVDL
jgi:16S rRNA (adenine1518-N6/adenine1519-N6)-dimethyltransferase